MRGEVPGQLLAVVQEVVDAACVALAVGLGLPSGLCRLLLDPPLQLQCLMIETPSHHTRHHIVDLREGVSFIRL